MTDSFDVRKFNVGSLWVTTAMLGHLIQKLVDKNIITKQDMDDISNKSEEAANEILKILNE